MKVTWQSFDYRPEKVRERYVRYSAGAFYFCEVGAERWHDLRQGEVDISELPQAVAVEAAGREGSWPSYVAWPLGAPPCSYCSAGQRTGLPGNACENCMNTGLENGGHGV